jgi:uncharacterized protein (DUF4415 family)
MKKKSQTDWKRLEGTEDSEIDLSEIPEAASDFWRDAVIWRSGIKLPITIQLDADVVAFFKRKGKGYQTAINAVLRRYVETRRRQV